MELLSVMCVFALLSSVQCTGEVTFIQDEFAVCSIRNLVDCRCEDYYLHCLNDTILFREGHCISIDKNVFSVGYCPFAYEQSAYSVNLTASYAELAEFVCGTLKRDGILCSKCLPGYGIPVFSKTENHWVKCISKV